MRKTERERERDKRQTETQRERERERANLVNCYSQDLNSSFKIKSVEYTYLHKSLDFNFLFGSLLPVGQRIPDRRSSIGE